MRRTYRKLQPEPQFRKMTRVPAGAATMRDLIRASGIRLRKYQPVPKELARTIRMATNREGYFRFRDTRRIVTDAHRRTKRAMARASRRANRV